MKKNKITPYRVWNGSEVLNLEHPPTEDDGQILRFTGAFDEDGESIFECDKVRMQPFQNDVPVIVGVVEYDEKEDTFGVRHGHFLSKLDFNVYKIYVVGNAFVDA